MTLTPTKPHATTKLRTSAPAILHTKPSRAARAIADTTPNDPTPALDSIRVLGRLLDDLERERVMTTNRIGALERERGEALPHLYMIADHLKQAEHLAELELVRMWRKHPLAAWAKSYRGLGEKSIARLTAEIGDPATRPNVAKLWAYCGYGDPARIKIPKNATQEEWLKRGRPRAKKQVWLISTSMLKAGNRAYYDEGRAKYETRDWTDGHKHNAALRFSSKKFLRDLWVAARQAENETHCSIAGHCIDDAHSRNARAAQCSDDAHPTSGGAA